MKYLDLTFSAPEENLACDEAFLELCEEGHEQEILRFWEPRDYFIVLGYSGKIKEEVNFSTCEAGKIRILRRPSGGGTVLQGPGCLNFALILKIDNLKMLKNITQTNQYILEHHKQALAPIVGSDVEIQGQSDLTSRMFKFSGNAQRRKRHFILFHGTFLLNFDISLIEKFLPIPVKQPSYRKNRTHKGFLRNLDIPSQTVKKALRKVWKAEEILETLPFSKIRELTENRYGNPGWNFKF